MGKFTKNNFLNTFNKIKEFFRHDYIIEDDYNRYLRDAQESKK